MAYFNILAAILVCTFCGWQLWYLNKASVIYFVYISFGSSGTSTRQAPSTYFICIAYSWWRYLNKTSGCLLAGRQQGRVSNLVVVEC